jgi:hypothetical protein
MLMEGRALDVRQGSGRRVPQPTTSCASWQFANAIMDLVLSCTKQGTAPYSRWAKRRWGARALCGQGRAGRGGAMKALKGKKRHSSTHSGAVESLMKAAEVLAQPLPQPSAPNATQVFAHVLECRHISRRTAACSARTRLRVGCAHCQAAPRTMRIVWLVSSLRMGHTRICVCDCCAVSYGLPHTLTLFHIS